MTSIRYLIIVHIILKNLIIQIYYKSYQLRFTLIAVLFICTPVCLDLYTTVSAVTLQVYIILVGGKRKWF